MARSAKERKQAAREASRSAIISAGRRTSKVTSWVDPRLKKCAKKSEVHPAFLPTLREPVGMSVEARFMELRPDSYSPIDWFALFHSDETLWPAIVEEAEWELTLTDGLEDDNNEQS